MKITDEKKNNDDFSLSFGDSSFILFCYFVTTLLLPVGSTLTHFVCLGIEFALVRVAGSFEPALFHRPDDRAPQLIISNVNRIGRSGL
jgi:hypothetical protein